MERPSDNFILDCATYEDYLDKFSTLQEKKLFRNRNVQRQVVKLGYHSTPIYTLEEFQRRKNYLHELLFPTVKSAVVFSAGKDPKDPVIKALADREILNKQKTISTIVFIKYRLKSGFDISGYIDFDNSLRNANLGERGAKNWNAIFSERIRLMPSSRDLSFYDWHRNIIRHNGTDNYEVVHDVDFGLAFMHRGDHKKIYVGKPKQNAVNSVGIRSTIFSEVYGQAILYDYKVFKKI